MVTDVARFAVSAFSVAVEVAVEGQDADGLRQVSVPHRVIRQQVAVGSVVNDDALHFGLQVAPADGVERKAGSCQRDGDEFKHGDFSDKVF